MGLEAKHSLMLCATTANVIALIFIILDTRVYILIRYDPTKMILSYVSGFGSNGKLRRAISGF